MNTAAQSTAWKGVNTLVETIVAIELASVVKAIDIIKDQG